MNRSTLLLPLIVAILLGVGLPAQAKDFALNFQDLPPVETKPQTLAVAPGLEHEGEQPTPSPSSESLLSIPDTATEPPQGLAETAIASLPPPPPTLDNASQEVPVAEAIAPNDSLAEATDALPTDSATPEAVSEAIALSFDLAPAASEGDRPITIPKTPQPAPPTDLPENTTVFSASLFSGGENSLVAMAIGSAEGTRTPNGGRTPAYFGHTDPGNQAWNLGSFSYQHQARSPEEADQRQLSRLQDQAQLLAKKAAELNLSLTLEEQLNALDLANQAPQAALDRGGYLDWLRQAHDIGLSGSEAILWARVRSFIDPDTHQWNAPGLGNNIDQISRDQERRMNAIAQAIATHPLAQAEVTLVTESTTPAESDLSILEQILNFDLS